MIDALKWIIIIKWIMAIITVEAVVEILVNGDIFFGLRNNIVKLNPKYLGKLIMCGYCMSVWIAASIAWLLPGELWRYTVFDLLIKTFVIHRLSNIWHELLSRWFLRLPWHIVLIRSSSLPDTVEVDDAN